MPVDLFTEIESETTTIKGLYNKKKTAEKKQFALP